MDHSTEKWTMYFLEEEELQLLRSIKDHPKLTIAGNVIGVDVGIVTGLNEFFVLTEQQVEQHSLRPFTQRLVGRSAQLQGSLFSEADWQANVAKQTPSFLLTAPDLPSASLPEEIRAYIARGEAEG